VPRAHADPVEYVNKYADEHGDKYHDPDVYTNKYRDVHTHENADQYGNQYCDADEHRDEHGDPDADSVQSELRWCDRTGPALRLVE